MQSQAIKQRWKQVMADLYSGHKGTFLTAYLPIFNGFNHHWKNQIESVVHNAERLMKRNHTPEAIEDFLRPVRRLAHEPELLAASGKGGWAIFRSESQFRIKRINIDIEPLSVVSQSFHIKPLLKWWQNSEGYYVLNLNFDEATLYESTGTGLKNLDSLPLLGGPIYTWIDEWLTNTAEWPSRPLVLSGNKDAIKSFLKTSMYKNIFPRIVSTGKRKLTNAQLLEEVEDCLIEESLDHRYQMKEELHQASKAGLASFSLERVAKMLVHKKVSRLYLAEDSHIWGLFNSKTGEVVKRNNQMDCRDDDILDDLAELAMKNGIDVVLLPKAEIPTGSSVAAIFNSQPKQYARPTTVAS